MQHLFVSYEIAKQLKDKGFKEDCLGRYLKDVGLLTGYSTQKQLDNEDLDEFILAPLNQQATDWLENKYGFFFERMYENINKEEVFMLWRKGDIERNHTHKSLEQMIQEALNLI